MDFAKQSNLTLSRILAQLDMSDLSAAQQKVFKQRLQSHFPSLFQSYYEVYGWQYDFFFHLQQLVNTLKTGFAERPNTLKNKDKKKLAQSDWYKQENMLGMACYVDLFGGDLKKLQKRIPYFKSMGINYVHLMPLYKSPEGDSDGGYAVSDYRTVNPALGSMDDLKALAKAFNSAGINMVLDFVFNHTSDEHEWAMAAKAGSEQHQAYYYMFDDKTIPNQYEENLREIFPQVRRGNFTYEPKTKKWVWTTFNSFQWDVNYSNPEVFNAITSEMLFLANVGCDALRLDALAFIWKEMGTNCENQAKAHTLIQAFNRCLQIVAPAVVFKSEAIVHPDEVVKYIDKDECQLSYNPLLMALIWNSLATRKTRLLTASMQKTGVISEHCSWVNYIRCHDDIGWTFDDQVAAELGINGDDHRYFLNQFYTGRFAGSFANGVAFGENPSTGDCRVCGSLASLCGLERAQAENDAAAIELAIKRILLVHSIILSVGGVPLLYAGDDFGLLNDYSYQNDPSKQHDARWVNRIAVDDKTLAASPNPDITNALKQLIEIRQSQAVLGAASTEFLPAPNEHAFAYLREDQSERCLCIANFSEHELTIHPESLACLQQSIATDLCALNTIDCRQPLYLGPYQFVWLKVSK
ncbi:alpha-amylase family glycosyl hydrolase [Glaciecola siphonariae]|uniref:Alpha-amylase family glycosyl hydrolase n=1 Tax=Glaciecola siphonariae TaxID=521012 RepID=A0ABV9LY85_9ALTE